MALYEVNTDFGEIFEKQDFGNQKLFKYEPCGTFKNIQCKPNAIVEDRKRV